MFLIYPLGERNAKVKRAVREKREAPLINYAKELMNKGVNCLDLCFSEEKTLFFVIDALKKIDIPLSIDTHSRKLLMRALRRGSFYLINSSYPDRKSLKFYLKLSYDFNASLVILSILKGKKTMSLEERKILIRQIIEFFKQSKFPINKLFIDVVILPFKYYPEYMYTPLILSSYINKHFPAVKTLAGLDNFTYREPNIFLEKAYYLLLSSITAAGITSQLSVDFFLSNDIILKTGS